MVIGDVGQDTREEVDFAPSPATGVVGGAGANYGWNCREGTIAFPKAPSGCDSLSGFVDPVFDYPHLDPGDGSAHGCAIIGGYVVRDQSLGDLFGRYLYTDYCTGEIRSILPPSGGTGPASGDRSEGLQVDWPVAFGEDSCGRVYLTVEGGGVYRFVGTPPASCVKPEETAGGVKPSRRARLRLSALPFGDPAEHRFELTARLAPCGESAGRWVLLKRGSHRVAGRRLSSHCLARFRIRVLHRETFRAVLSQTTASGSRIRSPRRVVRPRAR